MQNAEIARLFEELANLLEIQGANPFRLRAYRNAARTVEGLTEPIADLAEEGEKALTELQGIGKNVAEKIIVICETGELPQLNEMREEIPAGVVMMLRISGIGPKKVAALYKELNLETLDQLKEAAENGDVAKLKGFGKKTAETILEGLEHIEQAGMRVYLADAMPFVKEIIESLSESTAITQ
ncbi:MAG: DNA polymerase/3'-5' exonuclease PolX, partial [Planctomycetes bacterium]|nr:DNA polymerase/3'-5' exonuclease PolX [Planctomycetota bacterium]